MRIVKTQKILYNDELRIRLIAETEDAEYIRLVRKLPDCRWSNHLNSWHTRNIRNHILFLNQVFPACIRFYDISSSSEFPRIEENQSEKRICIYKNYTDNSLVLNFLYDSELTTLIKKLGGKSVNANIRGWQISNTPEIAKNLNKYLENANYRIDHVNEAEDVAPFSGNNTFQFEHMEKFRDFLFSLKYGNRTINQYVYNVSRYLSVSTHKKELTIETIRDYIDEMAISRNFSRSYQNQLINSLKAYYLHKYGNVPGRGEIPRPRWARSIPVILTRKEVWKIINLIPNLKHNVLISTIYMTGITTGETVLIKPEDIDPEKMQIVIRNRNDEINRTVPLIPELLQKIDLYRKRYHPENFLFEGYHGKKYSERCIQKVLKKYVQKAGIIKKASVHTLRHSFASQLLESGADMSNVQRLLGHKSRKSTEIYSFITPSGADSK